MSLGIPTLIAIRALGMNAELVPDIGPELGVLRSANSWDQSNSAAYARCKQWDRFQDCTWK